MIINCVIFQELIYTKIGTKNMISNIWIQNINKLLRGRRKGK